MNISMNHPPEEMSLAELQQRCTQEIAKFRHKDVSDDSYCLEVFRRAIQHNDQQAWTMLHEQYTEVVHVWFRRHTSKETALRYMNEEDCVARTFTRFWQAVRKSQPHFESLASALSYLHLCLTSTILDTIRDFARSNVVSLPEYEQAGQAGEPVLEVEDSYHEGELWEIIKNFLPGEREKRVAYLLLYCNLKPREIIRYAPGEFQSENEIYSLRRNIWERIMRNADKIRWRLSDTIY